MEGDFQSRLDEVNRRIGEACQRAGRDPGEVSLLAVSKNFGPEAVCEAAAAGVLAIGESRIQEAAQKIPLCPGRLEWHMIGHLQRNKVRAAVELFSMVHAVDSWRLLETIDRVCEEAGRTMAVCLEVNIAGESSKFGMPPGEVPGIVRRCGEIPRVDLVGLMTIPPFARNPEDSRVYFRRLREVRDACQKETGALLPHLSMGMSDDFEVAVEEGATWVRLGTILFGKREGRWKPEGDAENCEL